MFSFSVQGIISEKIEKSAGWQNSLNNIDFTMSYEAHFADEMRIQPSSAPASSKMGKSQLGTVYSGDLLHTSYKFMLMLNSRGLY